MLGSVTKTTIPTQRGRRKYPPEGDLSIYIKTLSQGDTDGALNALIAYEKKIKAMQTDGEPADNDMLDMLSAAYLESVTGARNRRIIQVLNRMTGADGSISNLLDAIKERVRLAENVPADNDDLAYVRDEAAKLGITDIEPINGLLVASPEKGKSNVAKDTDRTNSGRISTTYIPNNSISVDFHKLALGFKILQNSGIDGQKIRIRYNQGKAIEGARKRRKLTYYAFCIDEKNLIMLISAANASSFVIQGTSDENDIIDKDTEELKALNSGIRVVEIGYYYRNLRLYQAEIEHALGSTAEYSNTVIDAFKEKCPDLESFMSLGYEEFDKFTCLGMGLVSIFRLLCGKQGDPVKSTKDLHDLLLVIYPESTAEIAKLLWTREQWIGWFKEQFKSSKEFLSLPQKKRNEFKKHYGVGLNKLASIILGEKAKGLNTVSNIYDLAILAAEIWGTEDETVKLFSKKGLSAWFKDKYKTKEALNSIGSRAFAYIKVEDILGATRVCKILGCPDLEPQNRLEDLDRLAEIIFAS